MCLISLTSLNLVCVTWVRVVFAFIVVLVHRNFCVSEETRQESIYANVGCVAFSSLFNSKSLVSPFSLHSYGGQIMCAGVKCGTHVILQRLGPDRNVRKVKFLSTIRRSNRLCRHVTENNTPTTA